MPAVTNRLAAIAHVRQSRIRSRAPGGNLSIQEGAGARGGAPNAVGVCSSVTGAGLDEAKRVAATSEAGFATIAGGGRVAAGA